MVEGALSAVVRGLLGSVGGTGVLMVGLVMGELLLVRALTMALVMFGLKCVFGLYQTADE